MPGDRHLDAAIVKDRADLLTSAGVVDAINDEAFLIFLNAALAVDPTAARSALVCEVGHRAGHAPTPY